MSSLSGMQEPLRVCILSDGDCVCGERERSRHLVHCVTSVTRSLPNECLCWVV